LALIKRHLSSANRVAEQSNILYVELFFKVTQYQLKIQLSSIYPKYLYSASNIGGCI